MQTLPPMALVTGAASGLGRAVAQHFHARGMAVALLDRTAAGQQVAEGLGARAAFYSADVTDGGAVAAALTSAVDQLGELRVAVNCAGVGTAAKTVDRDGKPMDLDAFVRTVTVNLVGSFNVARLAAARMASNQPDAHGQRGVIVNTASVAAFDGQMGQVAYAASKGGIVSMTLPMARDLARSGIRVMTIAPGIFDTPMLAGLPDDVRAALGASVPFPPRLGQPSEYAQLVAHIVDNPMLNGEVIRLDGALRMAPR